MKRNALLWSFFVCLMLFTSSFASADSCITATCHQAIAQIKNQHQPVKEGDCFACHKPKGKEHPGKGGALN